MDRGAGHDRAGRDLRSRIEEGLGRWAHFVDRFRWLVFASMGIATIVLAAFIPSMQLKMSTEDFLFEDDPIRAEYERFKSQFGQDQVAILTVEPPEIFDVAFLTRLREFHEALEDEVPLSRGHHESGQCPVPFTGEATNSSSRT